MTRDGAAGLDVRLDRELPAELAVGGGTCLFVSGSCSHPAQPVKELAIAVDGASHPTIAHGVPRTALGGAGGFWGFVPFGPVASSRRARLELVVRLDGERVLRHGIGETELLPRVAPAIDVRREPVGEGPLVAICMATYEPPARLLERQIESLREQTHRSWVCLISDDCSSPESHRRLASLIGSDPRFVLSRSPTRLGFYRNFERVLSMVPPRAELVALCDQDDRWHPEKLETLIAAIGRANLAFSDMRVLDEDLRVLSETFWSYKRNNHRNLGGLLIDNAVTGAASLFRRSILEQVLPFPPPLEGAFHDHWIASVALASGEIAYVDRPLHDYIQHAAAVTSPHPATLPELSPPPLRPSRLSRSGLRFRLEEGRRHYFHDACRIALAARVLEVRCADSLRGRKRRAARRAARIAGPRAPVAWLAARLVRARVGFDHTMQFERRLLKATAWRRAALRDARRAAAGKPPPVERRLAS